MQTLTRRGFGFPNDKLLSMLLYKDIGRLNLGGSTITSEMLNNVAETCRSLTSLTLTDGHCFYTTNGLHHKMVTLPIEYV